MSEFRAKYAKPHSTEKKILDFSLTLSFDLGGGDGGGFANETNRY